MTNSTQNLRSLKEEYAALLAEKDRRIAANPLAYASQHPKQIEASESPALIRALFWGNRVGKTEWGAQEVAEAALGQHPWIPPGEMWVWSPGFDEQKDTTQKKLLMYIPESRIISRAWVRKDILRELVIDAGNGRVSRIGFKSYEQGWEKAQGAGKVLIWFDEEPPKAVYEESSMRMEAGQPLYIIMTMTPVKGLTWVYNEIYLPYKDGHDPNVFVSEASWLDNPWLTPEQIAQLSRGLNARALQVRKFGRFMQQTGLVCQWFDRDVHVVDMDFDKLPPGDNLFGLDFGFNAPAAGLYARVDKYGNWWLFDGFYRKGLTNPALQKIMKLKDTGLARIKRFGDSAQAGDIKQLKDAGFNITGVKKTSGSTKESWDEYRARRMDELGQVDSFSKRPRIFISKDLVDENDDGDAFNFLVWEIENLRWDESATSDDSGRSVWGKQAKHAIDALSYMIVSYEGEYAKKDDEFMRLYNSTKRTDRTVDIWNGNGTPGIRGMM